jgi:hypothetical protein
MLSIQLVLLTSLAGDATAIQSNTLINTNESTAAKLLEHKFARKLLKHEPTEEQLSKAIDFVDDDGKDSDETNGEDSNDADSDTGDEDQNPQRNRRRTRSKPDA